MILLSYCNSCAPKTIQRLSSQSQRRDSGDQHVKESRERPVYTTIKMGKQHDGTKELLHSSPGCGARLLESKSTPSPTPVPTSAPSVHHNETSAAGISDLATEFPLKWILWLCVGLLSAYIFYKVYRWWLRRRRRFRSENGGEILQELEMLPSEDFSDNLDCSDDESELL